jgi:hypothetical protein
LSGGISAHPIAFPCIRRASPLSLSFSAPAKSRGYGVLSFGGRSPLRRRLLLGQLPAKRNRIGTGIGCGPSAIIPSLGRADARCAGLALGHWVVHARLPCSAESAFSASCNAALTMSALFTSGNLGRRRVLSVLMARSSSWVSRTVTRLPVSFCCMSLLHLKNPRQLARA